MLTPEQKIWLNHLSNTDSVKITPFDKTALEKFRLVKQKINQSLGLNVKVEHRGATSLGISGQDEIDVYIPVNLDRFNYYLKKLEKLFGKPKSLYTLDRARFVTFEDGKHIDVFLINQKNRGWLDGVKFETFLKSHPTTLEIYRKLKEEGSGLSTREYYRKKIEFINNILNKVE